MLKKKAFGSILHFLTFFYNIFTHTNFVGDEYAENRKQSKPNKYNENEKNLRFPLNDVCGAWHVGPNANLFQL